MTDVHAEFIINLKKWCIQPEVEALGVTTIKGDTFTGRELVVLVQLIYSRFGLDMEAARAAYARLLQSDVALEDFERLVKLGEHRSYDRLLHYTKC